LPPRAVIESPEDDDFCDVDDENGSRFFQDVDNISFHDEGSPGSGSVEKPTLPYPLPLEGLIGTPNESSSLTGKTLIIDSVIFCGIKRELVITFPSE